jgi:hypothetical protein
LLLIAHADKKCSVFNEAQLSESFAHYYCFDASCPLVSAVLPAVDDDTGKQLTTILLLVLFIMRKCFPVSVTHMHLAVTTPFVHLVT